MIHKRCKTISKILKFGPRCKSLCTPVSSEWVVEDVKELKTRLSVLDSVGWKQKLCREKTDHLDLHVFKFLCIAYR
jgi:hypothetical protein